MAKASKTMARVVHLYAGLDLIGSKSTISGRDAEISVHDWGVRMVSKKTKRIIRIYASNIKGLEELPQLDSQETDVIP